MIYENFIHFAVSVLNSNTIFDSWDKNRGKFAGTLINIYGLCISNTYWFVNIDGVTQNWYFVVKTCLKKLPNRILEVLKGAGDRRVVAGCR